MKKGLLLCGLAAAFAVAIGCDNQKSTTPTSFHPAPAGISGNEASGAGGKKAPPPKGETAAPIQP